MSKLHTRFADAFARGRLFAHEDGFIEVQVGELPDLQISSGHLLLSIADAADA